MTLFALSAALSLLEYIFAEMRKNELYTISAVRKEKAKAGREEDAVRQI